MFISPENPVPESHPVDAVFALLSDNRLGPQMPCEHGSIEIKPLQPSASLALDATEPPPGLGENQDLRTAHEWLQTERARLEEYTRVQFGKVQQQHQELMAVHFQHEQEAALQAQEINREIQRLASFSGSLDERSNALDERDEDLKNLNGKLSGLQAELRTSQHMHQALLQDVSAQREIVEELNARAARLRVEEDTARHAFEIRLAALAEKEDAVRREVKTWETNLAQNRSVWDQKESETTEGFARLDERREELDEREVSLNTRKQEIAKAAEEVVGLVRKRKTMEKEIQTQLVLLEELRGRTTRLRALEETARSELESWETRVGEAKGIWNAKESELAGRYSQLEQRYQALERSEEALKRRMTEVNETEHRVESEFERQEKQLAMDCREIDRLRAILRAHGLDPVNAADVKNPLRVRRKAIRVE